MSQLSAEQLAQRIYDCGLIKSGELNQALQSAGGRDAASCDDLIAALLEQEKLTNWQIARVHEGHRRGYFYGDWKVLYLIGAGTFARVYRAVHQQSGEIKAVKVLRQRYCADLESREQFLREARMVMGLRHPNIVPIHEVDEERDRIYMVMDFVEGQNLREYVKAHRKLPVMTSLKIIRDIAAGLSGAAENSVAHRDMKLSNVLLASTGRAKVVDFGLAAMEGETVDGKGGPRSIDYAGLERATRVKRDDRRSDLYFVGCMLYQLVSGVSPLLETRERIKRLSAQRFTDVQPVTVHEPDLPHRVVILIERLMDLDANKRIQTPALVVQETEAAIRAIEAGDVAKFNPELADSQSQQKSAAVLDRDEGLGKTLLVIETKPKVQDALRKKLKELGYRVLITSDPVRGLGRFDDLDPADDMPADCVIISCAGLGREGVSAFSQFMENESASQVPAILVVPDKLEKHIDAAWFNDYRVKLSMPLTMKQLRKHLRKLLKLDDPDSKPVPREMSPAAIVVNEQTPDTDVEL